MQIIYSFQEQERGLLKRLSTLHTIYYLIVFQFELTLTKKTAKNINIYIIYNFSKSCETNTSILHQDFLKLYFRKEM